MARYYSSSSSDSETLPDSETPPDSESPPESRDALRFYVTRESQENLSEVSRKESYAGMRDLSDLEKIQERDIMAPDGSIRGIKNRVRAGLANFENREALEKVSIEEGGAGREINYFALIFRKRKKKAK